MSCGRQMTELVRRILQTSAQQIQNVCPLKIIREIFSILLVLQNKILQNELHFHNNS